ncbi:MAG: 3-hydroxybutyryl-CoA dehydrogenase [Streptosporangiaceae bacterium]
MEIREVGVIGLGTMGAGIAEVFARGGLQVIAVEADAGALARGMGIIDDSLSRAVSRGRMSEQERAEVAGRITPAGSLADLSGADLVIEVVPEQMPIKREIVTGLDKVLRPGAIIATNTSSLSVTTIAAHSARPDRVIGMHFFNPAPVMKLAEVVTTVLTDPAVGGVVTDLARALGKTPVQVTDRAGFVANALLLPYLNHAIRLLETGYASREDIDLAVTAGIGLPMGPLTLLDLIGLDTSLAVLEVLQHEFGGSRYTPAPLLRRLTDAGRVGRKSGAGFYDYRQDGPGQGPGSGQVSNQDQLPAPGTVTVLAAPAAAGAGQPAGPGAAGHENAGRAVAGPDDAGADELARLIEQAGITVTRDPGQPSDLVVVVVGPGGGVTGPAAAAGRLNDAIGLHLVTPELAELVAGPGTSERAVATARALADRLGVRSVRSPDRPGLLVGALLYPHLRDAVAMVGDGYATPADVDAAMTLGCGYPRGPMTLLAEAGPDRATAVLAAMHAAYGDPAFAPHPLLADYAAAAVSPLEYPGR